MASISKDTAGNRTVQFVGTDGRRRSVRLGKVNAKMAEGIKLKVETLAASVAARLPLDSETAAWLGNIGDDLAAKLAAVGLIPPRQSAKLGEFLAAYLDKRRAESKPATVVTIGLVVNDLNRFYGEETDLRAITEAKADEFRTHYLTRKPKLAAATTARRLKVVRMLFDHARRLKLIPSNPFSDLALPNINPDERRHYVSPEDTAKVLAACNPMWRIIVALARFGGLRCPSEVLSLKWEHVNFETNRMTVPSCKTEHLPGKAYRVVPIFAELRSPLEEAFELAEDGAVYVVPGDYRKAALRPGGWVNSNIRTQFEKIIRRAGLKTWPRLFQNLRASRETDLMKSFPIHVVTAWIGNTPKIALAHYLQTLDGDFERAVRGGAESGAVVVQNVVRTQADVKGPERTDTTETVEIVGSRRVLSDSVAYCPNDQMAKVGLEPTRLLGARF